MSRIATLLAFALLVIAGRPAHGGQYLVGPGEAWSHLAGKLRPGDEVILMPGAHVSGTLDGITGAPGKPIVIRGLTVDKPSVIEAKREGVRLRGASFVIVRDLSITGATINGIVVTAPDGTTEEAFPAHVTIENVTIERIGPEGRRHGVMFQGVRKIKVRNSVFRGWGGSALDFDASAEIEVSGCRFEGLEEHSQRAGIALRGGSDRARILDCTFVDCGPFTIEIGAKGDTKRPFPSATVVKRSEKNPPMASRVNVMRCTFHGSGCPVHFYGAHTSSVRNCTFHRPRQWALAIDVESPKPPPAPSLRLAYGSNLVVWEPGDLRKMIRVGASYKAPILALEENLWWSPGDTADLGNWPETPAFPQIVDVDPLLDDRLKPKEMRAELFGSASP